MTQTIVSALAGVALGGVVTVINGRISKRALQKGEANALTGAILTRMLLDVLTLGLVYLLRGVLPFSYEPMLIGTATALALGGILVAAHLTKQLRAGEKDPGQEQKPRG